MCSNLHVFAAIVGRKTSSPERLVLLDFPFRGFLNIDCIFGFCFKSQGSNFSVLGMKQNLVSFKIWPAMCHDYLHFSRAQVKEKVFLGPLKSSKNMLRKSVLIGLYVFMNNKRIREPKHLDGRVGKGNCPHMLFWGSYGQYGELESFFAQAVTGDTGVNGLNYIYIV